MIYYFRYDFDNYAEPFDFDIFIRNGACFKFLDSIVKFYSGEDKCLLFKIDSNNVQNKKIEEKLKMSIQTLSFLFSVPIYEREFSMRESTCGLDITNNLMSKRNTEVLKYVENKVLKFKVGLDFYNETLELLMIANNHNFNNNIEDGFFYYFRVIEKIAKKYYIRYMDRHHTKSTTKKNKNDLYKILKKYLKDNLDIVLTEDMLLTKTDLFYKTFKNEFYGSIFSKISLFITQNNVNIDVNVIGKLVKVRNKLAHGDLIDEKTFADLSGSCEILAIQMFSIFFFNKKYEELHIKSQRFFKGDGWWD